MGASLVYLDKPNKEIQFDLGENSHIKFAAGGMQGWRINMVSLTFDTLNLYYFLKKIIWKLLVM